MTRAWPLFDLSVRTPALELRYATDELLLELTDMSGDVIPPGTLPFDGDATFYDASPNRERRWLRGQWGARSRTSPEWWVLVFAIVVDGRAVGTQEMTADAFPTVRTVSTFSWIARSHQRRGIGKESRAAILHLAFEALGAARATSEAFLDNVASMSVSRSLGYREDGTTWTTRKGQVGEMQRFVLSREDWQKRRRSDIEIIGFEPARKLLGL